MRRVFVWSAEPFQSVALTIPNGWDRFVFRGYLYVLRGDTFDCVGEWPQ